MDWLNKRIDVKMFTGIDTIGKVINQKEIVVGKHVSPRGAEPHTEDFCLIEYFDDEALYRERVWLPAFLVADKLIKRCF